MSSSHKNAHIEFSSILPSFLLYYPFPLLPAPCGSVAYTHHLSTFPYTLPTAQPSSVLFCLYHCFEISLAKAAVSLWGASAPTDTWQSLPCCFWVSFPPPIQYSSFKCVSLPLTDWTFCEGCGFMMLNDFVPTLIVFYWGRQMLNNTHIIILL